MPRIAGASLLDTPAKEGRLARVYDPDPAPEGTFTPPSLSGHSARKTIGPGLKVEEGKG